MKSEASIHLLNRSQSMVSSLYRITVTDSWYPGEGGNIEVASMGSQIHSMASVLSGIRGTEGRAPSALGGRHIVQSKESWLAQGQRTLALGKGVCTDCAAAAAVKFLQIMNSSPYEAKVEIISSTTHAFVVVNREGGVEDVRATDKWGDDAFVIDVWYQNQFPRNAVAGVFWANDQSHPVAQFIRKNHYRLRVDVSLREVLGSLFD